MNDDRRFLTDLLEKHTSRRASPEYLYEVMLSLSDSVRQSGHEVQADSILRTASTLRRMFGLWAEDAWRAEKKQMPLPRRLFSRREPTAAYVMAFTARERARARSDISFERARLISNPRQALTEE